jgi:Flp pilus assembly protein TadG
MALISPLLLFLIIVTADTGRAFSALIAIGNGAREGASFGARSIDDAMDANAVQAAVIEETGEIFGALPQVQSSVDTDTYGYEYIRVTVRYTFEPILPMPGFGEIELSREAEMRIVG